jgi:hypothetical protein
LGRAPSRGLYVGFRKIDAERGSRIARRFDTETRKHSYKSLGWATVNFDYDKAKVRNRDVIGIWERAYETGGAAALHPHAAIRRIMMTNEQTQNLEPGTPKTRHALARNFWTNYISFVWRMLT